MAFENRQSNPEMANAAETSPERFAQLMSNFQQQHQHAAVQRRQDEELLNSDPYDIEVSAILVDPFPQLNSTAQFHSS